MKLFRRFGRRTAVLIAAASLIGGTAAVAATVAAPVASASTYITCSNNGAGPLCINRKAGGTGSGTPIILYAAGSNETSEFVGINACNSHPVDEVTQTCPFTVGSGLNSSHAGEYIEQLEMFDDSGGTLYGCVGTTTGSGNAILTGCNNPGNGQGGGTGTMFINTGTSGNGNLLNRYWADVFYGDGGDPGAILNAPTESQSQQLQVESSYCGSFCVFSIGG